MKLLETTRALGMELETICLGFQATAIPLVACVIVAAMLDDPFLSLLLSVTGWVYISVLLCAQTLVAIQHLFGGNNNARPNALTKTEQAMFKCCWKGTLEINKAWLSSTKERISMYYQTGYRETRAMPEDGSFPVYKT